MKIVTDYKIVTAKKRDELSQIVVETIRQGYQPFGSMVYEPKEDFSTQYYSQPMVKYGEENAKGSI